MACFILFIYFCFVFFFFWENFSRADSVYRINASLKEVFAIAARLFNDMLTVLVFIGLQIKSYIFATSGIGDMVSYSFIIDTLLLPLLFVYTFGILLVRWKERWLTRVYVDSSIREVAKRYSHHDYN